MEPWEEQLDTQEILPKYCQRHSEASQSLTSGRSEMCSMEWQREGGETSGHHGQELSMAGSAASSS